MTTTNQKPTVLLVYHTFSKQTEMVVDVMAETFAARGCEPTKALIEFPDPKWTKHLFTGVPMKRPAINLPTLPSSWRRTPANT
jgi:hypothetical protein